MFDECPCDACCGRVEPDSRDYCWMCDTEIPPGPDFCDPECEAYFDALNQIEILIARGLDARVQVVTEVKCFI